MGASAKKAESISLRDRRRVTEAAPCPVTGGRRSWLGGRLVSRDLSGPTTNCMIWPLVPGVCRFEVHAGNAAAEGFVRTFIDEVQLGADRQTGEVHDDVEPLSHCPDSFQKRTDTTETSYQTDRNSGDSPITQDQFEEHRAELDFAALDVVLPHPAYATHGSACILNPTARRLPEVDQLLAYSHRRRIRTDAGTPST